VFPWAVPQRMPNPLVAPAAFASLRVREWVCVRKPDLSAAGNLDTAAICLECLSSSARFLMYRAVYPASEAMCAGTDTVAKRPHRLVWLNYRPSETGTFAQR
jgi:hypothetical protein